MSNRLKTASWGEQGLTIVNMGNKEELSHVSTSPSGGWGVLLSEVYDACSNIGKKGEEKRNHQPSKMAGGKEGGKQRKDPLGSQPLRQK